MEKEIYNLIKKIIYEESINNSLEEKGEYFDYPIKIEKVTFDILDIFNNLYFKKYKKCLIDNAAIYSIKNNDINYINLFNNKNIDELIECDRSIKRIITQRAFYNIYEKIKNNKNNDKEIINNNIELYNKLNRNYKIETLTQKLRKIILNFINNYNNSYQEILLDLILTTNKFDNDLLNYDNFFNLDNLKLYKRILFKIVLSDNYLYLKSIQKDFTTEYCNQNINEIDENVNYDYVDIDNKILDILESNNLYELENEALRLILYDNFIIYNVLLCEQKQDFDNIKEDKLAVKTLKNVNKFFFLDLF